VVQPVNKTFVCLDHAISLPSVKIAYLWNISWAK